MMRVLEAFGEPISFGGQESFVMNTISHMDLGEFSFDLLTPYFCDNEGYRSWVRGHGGEVYELGVEFNPGGDRRSIVGPVSEFLGAHAYDVVHVHSGSTSVLALMAKAAKEHGVPCVIVHSHAPVEHFGLKNWLIREAYSWDIERNADVLCAASRNAAEAKYAPRLQKKACIIKNGIDLGRFTYKPQMRKRMRVELGFNQDNFVIGHVGRFSYEKNQVYLVDLYDIIRQRDESARLLFVGGGDELEAVKRLVCERKLEGLVTFTGPIERPEECLQAMDVFAFPSRFESLGMSLVEAEATGLPTVSSNRVPDEARVITSCRKLPIEEKDKEAWADAVLSFKGVERRDCTNDVRAAGFDAVTTAKYVATLYRHKDR